MAHTLQKKICLLGDIAVGKTSLVRRFVYNRFDEKYLSTIGVNISRKEISVGRALLLRLVVWDLAGGSDFTGPHANYIKGAAGALLVCDLTRVASLAALQKYAAALQAASPGAATVIVANKSDLTGRRELSDEALKCLSAELQSPLLHTSAKTDANVEQAFELLAKKLA